MPIFEGANVNIHGSVKHTVVHGNQTVFMQDNSVRVLGNHNNLRLLSPPAPGTKPHFGSHSRYPSSHLAHKVLDNPHNGYPISGISSTASTHKLSSPSLNRRNRPLLLPANSQEITPALQDAEALSPMLPNMSGPSSNAHSPHLSSVSPSHDTLSPMATLAHSKNSSSLSVAASVTELESTESMQPSATSTAATSVGCFQNGASSTDQLGKNVVNPPTVKEQKWWKWKRWFPKRGCTEL